MSYLEELLPEFRKGAKIRLSSWNKNKFIVMCDKDIVTNDNYDYPLSMSETLSNQWELYQEPEPDWDYIIKNKCLCWFWDYEEESKFMDILYKFNDKSRFKFVRKNGGDEYPYINCRPVQRDEVTFYEDKKNGKFEI